MTSTGIVGSTGLVGTHILSTLLSLPAISTVHSLSRRAPKVPDAKLHPLTSTDTSTWATSLSTASPPPSIFFSALGTTKAAAGSIEGQRAIDYDLNLSVAKAAKEVGVKTYVLISSSGANIHSSLAYPAMKGALEDSIRALDFEHTIILRPGLIVGAREDSRPLEFGLRKMADLMGRVGMKDFWAQDASVIARAAVKAALDVEEGKGGKAEKVVYLGQGDIVRLGRTEWKV